MSEHGTLGRYCNGHCRCQACRDAMASYIRRWRAGRHEETAAVGLPPHVSHGTTNAYTNYGCTCQACRDVHAAAERTSQRRRAQRREAQAATGP